jgi:hypothetical protein
MQGPGPRPSSEEIDSFFPKLSGARPRKQEAKFLFFDQPMNLIEQLRYPLNLVNHDQLAPFGGCILAQPLRVLLKAKKYFSIEQVENDGAIFKMMVNQRGLAGLARPEKKAAFLAQDG